jgi:hypothetical protein
VWLARGDDGSEAALKIVTAWDPKSERYQRFQNEVNVHQRIGLRTGIVPMLDYGFPEEARKRNYPSLAMPEAVPLRQHLESTPALSDVVQSIASVAEALAGLKT